MKSNVAYGVGDGAFSYCWFLTSVHIPDGVTEIGDEAFRECDALESLHIPASVTTIGYKAFDGCSALAIYAPKGSYATEYAKENGIPFKVI